MIRISTKISSALGLIRFSGYLRTRRSEICETVLVKFENGGTGPGWERPLKELHETVDKTK
jgi:hypothetical protein